MLWEMVCTCSMAMKLREAHMVESSSTPKVSPLIAIWTLYQAAPPGLLHSSCSPRMWLMTGLGIQFGPSGCGRLALLSDACMAISFVWTTQMQQANAKIPCSIVFRHPYSPAVLLLYNSS